MDDSGEAIYDEYLDALLAGDAVPPEDFLRARGFDGGELLSSLRAAYEQSRPSVGRASGDGRVLGDFRLIERLGEGGMGVVWLAEQVSLGRRVALKVIRGEMAASLSANARFAREARAVARLHHPGIVAVHAMGQASGVPYIAMEYVEGRGLDEVIDEARASGESIATARVIRWGAGIARALRAAHEQGVVHRDVKPSNIRVTPDDRAMLLDFGLARELGAHGATLTEAFVGSPYYAAPEQVGRRGGEVDGRTDVYSLGVVLYELLAGRLPIEAGSLEQVLQSILADEPASLRKVNPRIGRDLATVVATCLEKDPARRYQTAALLADDLEAILELRPIRAVAPGLASRGLKWMARHRAITAGAATGVLAAMVFGAAAGAQRLAQWNRRHEEIRSTLRDAEARLVVYREDRERLQAMEAGYEKLRRDSLGVYRSAEQDREFDEAESRVDRARKERELAFHAAMDLAGRAERLGADPAEVRGLRGRLYLEKYLEAEAVADAEGRALYRELIGAHDPEGALEAAIRGPTRLSVACDPSDAEVLLYRRVLASDLSPRAEARTVPVPIAGELPAEPGQWTLRVVRGAGDIRAGDHILSVAGWPIRGVMLAGGDAGEVRRWDRLVAIDEHEVRGPWQAEYYGGGRPGAGPSATPGAGSGSGGSGGVIAESRFVFERAGRRVEVRGASARALGVEVLTPAQVVERGGAPAVVWSEGASRECVLPEGLIVRATAAPIFLGPAASLGRGPIRDRPLEAGSYAIVCRAPGRETHVVALNPERGTSWTLDISLLPEGATPPGWVYVTPPPTHQGGHRPFWIMEREVTVREYFEFLNDPAVLSRIDASPTPILYPQDGNTARGQRDPDGRLALPDTWSWEWPIIFVSWHDAKEYAAWLTARVRAQGRHVVCDLPTAHEWVIASAPAFGDAYVWGPRFRPKWTSSCFSHPAPDPEPVVRYPIDESILGVFDLAGSASEWTDRLWTPGQRFMAHAGGAWGGGDPNQFKVYGANGQLPEKRVGMVGFRLVMRPGGTTP